MQMYRYETYRDGKCRLRGEVEATSLEEAKTKVQKRCQIEGDWITDEKTPGTHRCGDIILHGG